MSSDPKVEEIRARLAAATPGPWRATRASWERSFNDWSKWEHPEIWGIVAGEQAVHKNAGDFHPENAEYTVDEIDVVQIGYDRDYSSAEAAISREADAELIASAPADIALLLTKLDEAEKDLKTMVGRFDRTRERMIAAVERERALIAGVKELAELMSPEALVSAVNASFDDSLPVDGEFVTAVTEYTMARTAKVRAILSRLLPSTPTEEGKNDDVLEP